jgi:hypothetical protein
MARLSIVLALVFGSLSLASAARAADDENAADVRCVVIAFGLTQSPDPQVKAFAAGASLYFVGRVRGRAPNLDLEAAIVKQVSAMTPQLMRGETQRCSGVLQEEGGKLRTIGEDMRQRAAAPAAPAAPTPK